MSIRPYKDKTGQIVPGKYILDFYPLGRKGKQVRQIVSNVTEAQAQTLELTMRRKYSNAPMRHDPMVIDVWPDWLKSCAREYAASTMKDIEWAALKLLEHFGRWHLSRLVLPLFEQYMDKRRLQTWRPPIKNPNPEKTYSPGKPVSKSRINTELKYFGLFLKYCREKGHMLPLQFDLPKFRRLPKTEKILPSLDEVDTLLKHCHADAKLAVMLYHDAGLRRGEGLDLKAEDVLLDDRVLSIIGKGNKQRFVIIKSNRLHAALKERVEKIKVGYLMRNPRKTVPTPYKDLRKAIEAAAERAGISKNIFNHLFRHAHTTRSLEAGEDLEVVRINQGHEDISTTQLYLHTKLEHRIREAKKFEEYLRSTKQHKTEQPTEIK